MDVLIACEKSAVIRDAFTALGHNAWSCDIMPSDRPGKHIQGTILDQQIVNRHWDLMIAHPDCTFLTVSANAHASQPWRMKARRSAVYFVEALWEFPIDSVVIENPIGVLSTFWMKPTQIIQPWQFGDDASKNTGLWIRGLPPLIPTNILPGGKKARRANQTASGQNKLPPSKTRKAERAQTYAGIARAMAEQWGGRIHG